MMTRGVRGLCAVAMVLCGLLVAAHGKRVALYMSEDDHVLDLKWDKGPSNLAAQLVQLGFTVEPSTEGQPEFGAAAPAAYVIPAQNGAEFYDQVEDMDALASYVSRGGLVVVLDSNTGHSDALKSFVSKAMGYRGEWEVCKHFVTNTRTSLGKPTLSTRASDFLSGSWPATLEDAQVTSVNTWCRHEDPAAISTPLYTVLNDEVKTVAQAFTKAGNTGAVVWLGYSWKDGVQENWGAMLEKIINEYSSTAAAVESVQDDDETSVESLIETVADAAADAAKVSRRFLAAPTYISPAPSAGSTSVKLDTVLSGADGLTQDAVCSILKTALGLPASTTCVFVVFLTAPSVGRHLLATTYTISVIFNNVPNVDATVAAAAAACGTGSLGSLSVVGSQCVVAPVPVSPAPAPNPIPIITFSPVPAQSPPSPVFPSPAPSPAPSPSVTKERVPFAYKAGMGTWGNVTGVVVWYGTPEFRAQRKPKTALNLVHKLSAATACNPTDVDAKGCYRTCPRTYQAWDGRKKDGIVQIPVYFANAVRITKIQIIQIWKPQLLKIELLAFAGVKTPSPQTVATVFETDSDTTPCQQARVINIDASVSHINDAVPPNTVADLAKSAYGGVLLTFAQPPRRINAARVDVLAFDGEALYANPDDYTSRRKQ